MKVEPISIPGLKIQPVPFFKDEKEKRKYAETLRVKIEPAAERSVEAHSRSVKEARAHMVY